MPTRLIGVAGLKIKLCLGHVDGLLHDGIDRGRLGATRPELLGDDGRSLGNVLHFQNALHTKSISHRTGDLLELEYIHLGKREQ